MKNVKFKKQSVLKYARIRSNATFKLKPKMRFRRSRFVDPTIHLSLQLLKLPSQVPSARSNEHGRSRRELRRSARFAASRRPITKSSPLLSPGRHVLQKLQGRQMVRFNQHPHGWFELLHSVSWLVCSKTTLKLAVSRSKLLKNKGEAQVRTMRRDLSQLLQMGQDEIARIRVGWLYPRSCRLDASSFLFVPTTVLLDLHSSLISAITVIIDKLCL